VAVAAKVETVSPQRLAVEMVGMAAMELAPPKNGSMVSG
jgi:hypothetical protein